MQIKNILNVHDYSLYKNVIICIRKCESIILILYLFLLGCSGKSNQVEIEEVRAIANKWREAVLMKQFDVLSAYALPEHQKMTIAGLKNKKSTFYQYIYLGREPRYKSSVWEVMKKMQRPEIFIAPCESKIGGTRYVVYYYDQNKYKQGEISRYFYDWKEDKETVTPEDIFIFEFYKENKAWRAWYGFDDEDD